MTTIDNIKTLLKTKKAVIGTERTMRLLKTGKLKKIYLTSNCPEEVKGDIDHFAKLGKVDIEQLTIPNDELGVICKRPFVISVLAELHER